MFGHYEIDIRKRITDDEKEYLSYSYTGTIQMVSDKVLISFNSGQVYKYVLGGSGASGYCETGSWRFGANLLTFLDKRFEQ